MSMRTSMTVGQHTTGYPSAIRSQQNGHILSVRCIDQVDNGNLIAADVDTFEMYDTFTEKEATTFTGYIAGKAVDGRWLVVVDDPGDALFVYSKPLTAYEEPDPRAEEEAMYHDAGDIARCYTLTKYDRFEVSEDGFNGTPKAGAKVTGVANKKLTVG